MLSYTTVGELRYDLIKRFIESCNEIPYFDVFLPLMEETKFMDHVKSCEYREALQCLVDSHIALITEISSDNKLAFENLSFNSYECQKYSSDCYLKLEYIIRSYI